MLRFEGIARLYDAHRPAPPAALAELLLRLVQPSLVVDLGSGTGLSTHYWAPHAERVVGIEPSDAMRAEAERGAAAHVSFRRATAEATGLERASATLVTCAQALHWLEPVATFREVARILRPGGVFVAFDYDWPPLTGNWRVDAAYERAAARARALEREHGLVGPRWDKESHARRLRESGHFAYVRELSMHHTDDGDAERLLGLFGSQSHVALLRDRGIDAGEAELRQVARAELSPGPWLWSCRVRLAVRG